MREQSIRDTLTGLYNRRYLEESLERELARARVVPDMAPEPRVGALDKLDVGHWPTFARSDGAA